MELCDVSNDTDHPVRFAEAFDRVCHGFEALRIEGAEAFVDEEAV